MPLSRPSQATKDEALCPRIYLEWVDSGSYDGWRTQEEVDELSPYLCRSCALLIKETPFHLVVAHSETYGIDASFKKMYVGVISIPKAAIMRRVDFFPIPSSMPPTTAEGE